jgi:hypothetical protein
MESLVELARRRFALLPVGVPYHVVACVFRRMMRLPQYMLRSAHVRLLAVDRLMTVRHACEFRTGNTMRWGKCVPLYSFLLMFESSWCVGGWEARPLTVDVNCGLMQVDTRTTVSQPLRRDDVDLSVQRMRPPSRE